MSTTTLRADPTPVRRWINPGEPGWENARLYRHRGRLRRGYVWVCPNHPEVRGGAIRGVCSVPFGRRHDEAIARLHDHFRRYHGAP